jgi:hypothetical protein
MNMRVPTLGLGIVLLGMLLLTGCFGGKDNGSSPPPPVPTVEMVGTLTLPTRLNSHLLAAVQEVRNTDTITGNAWSKPAVAVNDQAVTAFTLATSTVSGDWEFRLQVPQAADQLYRLEVNVGKVGLKAWVRDAARSAFAINSRTTAAALLARASGLEADALLATFPAMVGLVAQRLEAAWLVDPASVPTTIFDLAEVKNEVASQAEFLKNNTGFDPTAMVAYLKTSNDLDSDGIPDLQIVKNIDGTAIRFFTALSASNSLKVGVSSVGDYSDAELLADFAADRTRTDRFHDASAKNFALGLYFKRSAVADTYLKLFIKRIDLVEGSFRGVVAEYRYVTATATAVATGTKTFLRAGADPESGAVAGSDFLTDGAATTTNLSFLDAARGLGSTSDAVKLVRAYQGKPDLTEMTYAEPFVQGDPRFAANTTAARAALNMSGPATVGDVFSICFPATGHYALIKIKAITATTITVDYKVNVVPGENKF